MNEGISSVSGAQSRPQRIPVPRGPNSHLWVPVARKSQPRSGRSTSTALNPCTPSTHTTYWSRGTRLSPARAAHASATGTRTPVPECTQVIATTFVRG